MTAGGRLGQQTKTIAPSLQPFKNVLVHTRTVNCGSVPENETCQISVEIADVPSYCTTMTLP